MGAVVIQRPRTRLPSIDGTRPASVSALAAIASSLQFAQHQQDDHDQQQQAQAAARKVSPRLTVRPGGKRPNQQQYQYHQQNRTQAHRISPAVNRWDTY